MSFVTRTSTHAETFPTAETLVHTAHSHHDSDLEAHGHEFAEIVLVRAGSARHLTQNTAVELTAGSVLTLGPGSWHSYANDTALTLSLLFVSNALLREHLPTTTDDDALKEIRTPGHVTSRRLTASGFSALSRLADAADAEKPGSTFGQLAYFYRVLDQLEDSVEKTQDVSTLVAPIGPSDAIADAMRLMRESLDTEWTVAALASAVALSPSHLTRLFNRDVGGSPMAHLNRMRAERMAAILRTGGTSVAAAGRAVGWLDAAYATRRFSAHHGLAPTSYLSQTKD